MVKGEGESMIRGSKARNVLEKALRKQKVKLSLVDENQVVEVMLGDLIQLIIQRERGLIQINKSKNIQYEPNSKEKVKA